MYESSSVEFEFAVRMDDGKVVHISEIPEVERGSKCRCVCPMCKRPMQAKLGHGKRSMHFAHESELDINRVKVPVVCDAYHSNESALHQMAKQIIAEHHELWLPAYAIPGTVDPDCNHEDVRQLEAVPLFEKSLCKYKDAILEMPSEAFVPDVCIVVGGRPLYVEIAVTHFVSSDKQQRIRDVGVSTVEIDISSFLGEMDGFQRLALEQTLLNKIENKKWIYNRHELDRIDEICSRNKKLEAQFQEEERKRREEEEQRQKWIATQQELRRNVQNKCHWLTSSRERYVAAQQQLHDDKAAEVCFQKTAFCGVAKNLYHGIPFFCNIPVLGEIVFSCDRRVWQLQLFERFLYIRKEEATINDYKVHSWLCNHRNDLLNKELVYIAPQNLRYNPDSLLLCAIREYLVHLSGMGFIDHSLYVTGSFHCGYSIVRNTINPPRADYANGLQLALEEIHPTNDPFLHLQYLMGFGE